MNGDLDRLDLPTADVATTMRDQSWQLESALLSATSALDRAVDLFVGALPGAEPAVPGPPTMAAPAAVTIAPAVNAVRVVNAAAAPVLVTAVGPPPWEPAGTAAEVPVGALPTGASPAVGALAGAEPIMLASPAVRPAPAVGPTLPDAAASLTRAVEPLVESARRSLVDALSSLAPAATIAEQLTSAAAAPSATAVTPIPAPSTGASAPTASLAPSVALEPTVGEGIVSRVTEAAPSPVAPGAATPPTEIPALGASELALRAVAAPTAGPLVERIMGVPEPPRGASVAEGVTITGGVNVQVSAETIDVENAEETARAIASHVLEELNRLIERDRFRRGLPTAATA